MGMPPIDDSLKSYQSSYESNLATIIDPGSNMPLNDQRISVSSPAVRNNFRLIPQTDQIRDVFESAVNYNPSVNQAQSFSFSAGPDLSLAPDIDFIPNLLLNYQETGVSLSSVENEPSLMSDQEYKNFFEQVFSYESNSNLNQNFSVSAETEFSTENEELFLTSQQVFLDQQFQTGEINSTPSKEDVNKGITPSSIGNLNISEGNSDASDELVQIPRLALTHVYNNANKEKLSAGCKIYLDEELEKEKINKIMVKKTYLTEIFYAQKKYDSRANRPLENAMGKLSRLIDPTTSRKQKRRKKENAWEMPFGQLTWRDKSNSIK